MHHACDVLQPCQGEVSSLAQILFGEPLTHCQVGRPVAVTTLPGFLASSVLTALAHKSKGGDLVQPGKPLRSVRDNPELLSITRLVEFIDCFPRRPGQCKCGDFR